MKPTLMTVEDVAAELQVSGRTVKRMIAERELPSIKVRAARRVLRSAFERYLLERERGATRKRRAA